MHRQLVNELTLELTLWPVGPLLVKSADVSLDPTRAEMEFVRSARGGAETVYLPGSSLKGALRTQCERLARTLEDVPAGGRPRLACNPLSEARDGPNASCGARLRRETSLGGEHAYRESCVVCQIFGNLAEAAHLRVSDAYPQDGARVEHRGAVAIDRVYANLAGGPYTLEVVTEGRFAARLALHNFALAHLGLVALALRDLADGRAAIGYGKSRGLGRLGLEVTAATLRYPGCAVRDGLLVTLAGATSGPADQIHGAGQFPGARGYELPADDAAPLPAGATLADDGWGAAVVTLDAAQTAVLPTLWQACVARWATLAAARGATT